MPSLICRSTGMWELSLPEQPILRHGASFARPASLQDARRKRGNRSLVPALSPVHLQELKLDSGVEALSQPNLRCLPIGTAARAGNGDFVNTLLVCALKSRAD
jgi:hypothetical protein